MGSSLEKVQKPIELAAAVAVVVSLLFLGYEVRQNTLAVRSAAAQAVNENFATWYTAVQSDRELIGVSMAGMRDFDGLSGADKAQFIALHMGLLLNAQNAFYQWQDGWLSAEVWRAWDSLVDIFFSTPGGRQFWSERGYMFGEGFRSHIEQVLRAGPDPHAKAWGDPEIYNQDAEQ